MRKCPPRGGQTNNFPGGQTNNSRRAQKWTNKWLSITYIYTLWPEICPQKWQKCAFCPFLQKIGGMFRVVGERTHPEPTRRKMGTMINTTNRKIDKKRRKTNKKKAKSPPPETAKTPQQKQTDLFLLFLFWGGLLGGFWGFGGLGFFLPVFLLYSVLGVSGFFLLVFLLYFSCYFVFLFLFHGCWVCFIILSFLSLFLLVFLSCLFCLDLVGVWILIVSLLGGGVEWLMGV